MELNDGSTIKHDGEYYEIHNGKKKIEFYKYQEAVYNEFKVLQWDLEIVISQARKLRFTPGHVNKYQISRKTHLFYDWNVQYNNNDQIYKVTFYENSETKPFIILKLSEFEVEEIIKLNY